MRDTLVYDVEVLRGPQDTEGGWNNPYGMGFGTAIVYDYTKDVYRCYGSEDHSALIRDLTGCGVVSFNGIKFDNHVILPPETHDKEHNWDDIDLLLEVVKSKFGLPDVRAAELKLGDKEVHDGSISLDGLSEGTLGLHKTGHGAHAPELIQQGKWAEVFAYNLNDVRLTRKLYDFARQYGFLVDRKGNKIKLNI